MRPGVLLTILEILPLNYARIVYKSICCLLPTDALSSNSTTIPNPVPQFGSFMLILRFLVFLISLILSSQDQPIDQFFKYLNITIQFYQSLSVITFGEKLDD